MCSHGLVLVVNLCYTIDMKPLAELFVEGLVGFFLIGALVLAPTVSYAADKGNEGGALRLIQSDSSLSLKPLEQHRFGIGFKNTGTMTWQKGRDVMTLRAKAKKESYFYHPSWKSGTVVMDLPKDAKGGEVVYFWFTLEAPKATGTYVEELTLYRDNQPLAGSITRIPVTVRGDVVSKPLVAAPVAVAVPPAQSSNSSGAVLTASKLIQSATSLTMKQYERTTFGIGFKNTSDRAWLSSDAITLRAKAAKESYFYDSSWKSGTVVMNLPKDAQPGELVYFWFTLFAPIYPRDYQEKLSLYAGETKIAGSDVAVPITVVPASSSVLTAATPNTPAQSGATLIETVPQQAPPASSAPQSQPGIIDDKIEVEQFIRVGLYHTTEPIRITAQKEYDIRDEAGMLLAHEQAGVATTVTFDFATKLYTVTTPSITVTTSKYVRLRGSALPYRLVTHQDGSVVVEPVADQDTIFEILSYTNRPSWSAALNDNTFRGELEVRYAPATDRLWVVNELLFEQYLKGIAETSNSSPYEYQKALIIAARTYGKYHIDRNSKHAAEGFTVKPTEADQVYRGYGVEKRLPNISRAIDETRGVMVYYAGTLAITPYSSNTDGRTRSWEEVWGGQPKPWLVSVSDPCCTGMSMRYSPTSYSHGVGMSARGALAMALDNKGFEEILKYYYTNIELRRKY